MEIALDGGVAPRAEGVLEHELELSGGAGFSMIGLYSR